LSFHHKAATRAKSRHNLAEACRLELCGTDFVNLAQKSAPPRIGEAAPVF